MRDIKALIDSLEDDVKTGKNVDTLACQMDPILFACPICKKLFDTKAKAIKCRDQPFDTGGLKVGDIVIVPGEWNSWYLDDPWIAFEIKPDPTSSNHFEHGSRMIPYFVVTAIHSNNREPHQCIVTLVTLCGGIQVGWNPANGEGHLAMYRIDGGKHCDIDSTWIETITPYLEECKPSKQMLEEAARLARVGISTRNLL